MNNRIESMLQNLMPMKLRLLMIEQSQNVDILLTYILKDNYKILSKISPKDYKIICNKIILKNKNIMDENIYRYLGSEGYEAFIRLGMITTQILLGIKWENVG